MSYPKFQIMELLSNNPLSLKEIQSKLKEGNHKDPHAFVLQNNLDLLIKHGIVEKILTKKQRQTETNYILYELTNLGSQLYNLSFSYQMCWKNKSYFLDHNLLNLPMRFYLNIGVFTNEKIQKIEGRPYIYSTLVDMYKNAEFVYNIVFELEGSKEVMDILLDNLKSNPSFHTKTIVGSNKRLDPHRSSKIIEFEEFKEAGRILQKEIPKNINISLVLTDKSALLSFPKKKDDNPDTDTILYGKNKNFLTWCSDYFIYCWERWEGKPFIDQNTDKD